MTSHRRIGIGPPSRSAGLVVAIASAVPFLALVFFMEVDRGRLRDAFAFRLAGWAAEDGPIEAGTALLAAAAAVAWGIVTLRGQAGAAPHHVARVFFTGTLTFLIFLFAGEEIAWGQRLLGYRTPDFFRAYNTQSELTLHNIEGVNERVNGILIIGAFVYGIVLPLAACRLPLVAARSARLGLLLPPVDCAPFFALAIAYRALYFDKKLYGNAAQEGLEFLLALAFLVAGLDALVRPAHASRQ